MKKPDFLLIDDVAALRRKVQTATRPLDGYWRNFRDLAATEPIGEFQALPALAWLITQEPCFANATRLAMRDLLAVLPLADCSVEAQLHAYTAGAPMARFSVFLDWIWGSGILDEDEQQELASRLVTQVYSHCYLRLKGRLPAGDNQQASMAFACAVTGYVFGVKRGASPAARQMFAEGVQRFHAFLASLGDGGWCGEGSTYHHQVLCPILALYTAFMEQVTGRNYFDCRIGNSTVREALLLAVQTINGAGMLPGWDQYGNCAPELKTHLAYSARRTGNAAILETIVQHGMWSENELLAWYNDDKVWTLIFWPEAGSGDARPLPATWLVPEVCGKLTSAGGQMELLQMWDHVDGGPPGRAHLNPNNIELCAHGHLHTADGHGPRVDPTYFQQPGGMSCMAAHSVVLVDGEGYRHPRKAWHGEGRRLVDLPSLKALRGDVSDLYSELWNVSTLQRTSLVLGDRLIVLHDRYAAPEPHRLTWQLMLRPEVTIDGCRATQRLREGGLLRIATSSSHTFRMQAFKDFPRGMEQRCHALQFDTPPITECTLAVVMRPEPGTQLVADISVPWAMLPGGNEIPPTLMSTPPAVDLTSEALHGAVGSGNSLWFGRTCNLTKAQTDAAERLSIRRGQVERLAVYVNGHLAPELFEHPSIDPNCRDVQKPDGRFWPSHYSVAGLLHEGENQIAIASSEFRGQSIRGPIQLLRLVDPLPAELELQRADDHLIVRDGDAVWRLWPDNLAHAELDLGDGCRADAEVAIRGGRTVALAGAARWQVDGCAFRAESRLDVEWNGEQLFIAGPPETPLEIEWRGSWRRVTAVEDLPFVVRFQASPGIDIPASPGMPPPHQPPSSPPIALCPYDSGLLAADSAARAAALRDPDWRVRIGACQALREEDREWAQPLLLELLREENALPLYPPITANWPFAKMKTTFLGWPTGDEPETAKRRYRLKTVILEALGRIGDARCTAAVIDRLQATDDLYPVTVQACLAAAALKLQAATPALQALTQAFERNTRESAALALHLLRGEMTTDEFQAAVYAR